MKGIINSFFLFLLFITISSSLRAATSDGTGPSAWCGYYGLNTGTKTSLGLQPPSGTKWDKAVLSVNCQGKSIASACPSGYSRLYFGTFTWSNDSIADSSFTCVKNATTSSLFTNSMSSQGMFCGLSALNSGSRSSVAVDGVFQNSELTCQGKRPLNDGCPTGYVRGYIGAVAWGDDSSADYIYTCIRTSSAIIKASDDRRGAFCGLAYLNSGSRNTISLNNNFSNSSIPCENQDLLTKGCPKNYSSLSLSLRSWHDDSSADALITCISTSATQCGAYASGSEPASCKVNGAWSSSLLETNKIDHFIYETKLCNSPLPSGSGLPCAVEVGFSLVSGTSPLKEIKKLNQCESGYELKGSICSLVLFSAAGKKALFAIYDEVTPQAYWIQANTGYQTVYLKALSLKKGDIVRLRGQAELTNDTNTPIAGLVMITANGNQISQVFYENVIIDQVHHLPYWTDAVYTAASDGVVNFELKMEAQRSDSSPTLTIEAAGYGHLVLEHYRDADATNFSSMRGVVSSFATKSSLISEYGYGAFTMYRTAQVAASAQAGDLFRLFGQTTSLFSSYDMHASALWANGAQISPWASQDHVWNTGYNPNWIDGIFTSSSTQSIDFYSTMHSSLGTSNPVGEAHILGMQYRTLTNSNASTLKFLKSSYQESIPSSFYVSANNGLHNVQTAIVNLNKGDILRVRAQKQFNYPYLDENAVYCFSQVIINSGSTNYSASTGSSKYMNNQMGGMPLYNDDLFVAPVSGTYAIYSQALCSAQAQGDVQVTHASLIFDVFSN